MAKILWISDAGTPTGFGKVTHEIAERLVSGGHEVHVLAVGWDARYPVDTPLKLYRASAGPTRNYLGLDRCVEVLRIVAPDVIVTLEDARMTIKRLTDNPFDRQQELLRGSAPIISYVPVDGISVPPAWKMLKDLVTVVPMSTFGADQLEVDPADVVYHGVDRSIFHSIAEAPLVSTAGILRTKEECRAAFGMNPGDFIVGRVDSNSGRKDWASTWKVIDWAFNHGVDIRTSAAAFHTMADAPQSGVDLNSLISKGEGTYLVTNATDWPERDVAAFINCLDVFVSTSRGEGFGLTIAEAMSCGVPVLATDCSAITEVVGPGGVLIPPKAHMTNPYGVELALAETAHMGMQLVGLSRNPERRAEIGDAGIRHVSHNFSWDAAAVAFDRIIAAALNQRVAT